MTATVVVPTVVQKTYIPSTNKTGTPIRLVKYFVKMTKTYQSDWIVAATYCPGTFLGVSGWTIDGSGDGAGETMTYTATGTKIVFGSANVGTAYAEVICQET